MTGVASVLVCSMLCGQVMFVPLAPPVANVRGFHSHAVVMRVPETTANGAVYTVNNERFDGPILSLAAGQLSIDSDPPRTLSLDEVERIDMGPGAAPTVIWIGQDNHDVAQPTGDAGPNGIQDIHLRCAGLAPQRSLTQVTVAGSIGGVPRIWLMEPQNTPFWRLESHRPAGGMTVDLYLEPPPEDCFEQTFEVTLALDDGQTIKSRVVAGTHTDAKRKATSAENSGAMRADPNGANDDPSASSPDVSSPDAANSAAALLLLVADETLHGQLAGGAKEKLAFTLSDGQQFDIPLSDVRGCWLRGDRQPDQRQMFDQRLQAKPASDWVLIEARDKTAAAVEGVLQGIADGKLLLTVGGETRKVALERVLGFVLAAHPARPRDDVFHQSFELRGGDKLSGRLVAVNADTLQVESLWGDKLTLPRSEIMAIVCRNGQATYLSDLEPIAIEETPYFSRRLPYRRDQNLVGDPIVLGGTTYRKGLAVHSRSVLTYALDGRFAGFRTRLGFDDGAPLGGAVAVRVLADGRELYANPDLRQDVDPPQLTLDVAGAKVLTLEVDFGRFEDVGDRIVWAGARVFRPTVQHAKTAASTSAPDSDVPTSGARATGAPNNGAPAASVAPTHPAAPARKP